MVIYQYSTEENCCKECFYYKECSLDDFEFCKKEEISFKNKEDLC